jgi:hypothetical protein
MGTLRADTITDGAGTGAPNFSQGAQFAGGSDALNHYDTQDLDLSSGANNFNGGTLRCSRIGNKVTLSSAAALTHTSGSNANTGAGVVPVDFRPPAVMKNIQGYNTATDVFLAIAHPDGTFEVEYRNTTSGASGTSQTTTGIGITISFNI